MATTNTIPRLMTADDLAALGDAADHVELIHGELIAMAPTNYEHGRSSGRVAGYLFAFVDQHGLGDLLTAEAGFVVSRDPDTVLVPDVSFVRADRIPAQDAQRKFADLAPDLVVEVVSPSDSSDRVTAKVMQYLDAGVRLVWVVHPAQRAVTVYTPDRVGRLLRVGDALDGGDVLPGLSLPVGDIFAR